MVCVVRVLFLLLFPSVEGCLLGQGVFVKDGEYCFSCPGVLHGELTDLGWVPKSLLEEYYDRLVVDLQDDIYLVVEMLDELPEGLSLLLDDTA
jgi:hypothetical protein